MSWKQLGCDKLDALLTRHVLMTGDQGLYTGFADGLSGFITKPYREAKKDGAAGFAKGFAKGSIELFVKPGAGNVVLRIKCDRPILIPVIS